MAVSEPPASKPDVPAEARRALSLLEDRLGTSLVAVYLHGSAAAGGLRRWSDVDLLVVVDEPLPTSLRMNLSSDLLAISGHYPFDVQGRRPLEVIVFRRAELETSQYPARAEFVYGEWLRDAIEGGAIPAAEENPEFTLLLAQAREDAMPLIGPAIVDLVATTPSGVIGRAIKDLLPELIASADGDERNVLLTMARMWRTATTGEFVSKDVAAGWAASQLTNGTAETLRLARDAYLGTSVDHLHHRPVEVSQAIKKMRDSIVSALRPIA